jgi:hypothetical protein
MTVRQMLASMSSGELTEWMAYDAIEPFGEPRADLRAGLVASAIVNHSMSPPKTPARPLDFMPFANGGPQGPIKLADPVAHGKLIARTLFGDLVK